MSDFLYQDQLDPDSYTLDLTRGDSTLDFTTVASATFKVLRKADGSTATWTATLSNQTTTTLTLTYLLAAGAIDTVKGVYVVYAHMVLTGSGKPQRSLPRELVFKGNYEV